MQYKIGGHAPRDPEPRIYQSLEPVIRGLGMSLVELNIFHGKGQGNKADVQVKAIVYKNGNTGIDDCARVHRGIMPRLEIAFPGKDVFLEVSSPGINRIIKEGSEFLNYIGREVKCYRMDISDWTSGVLISVDEEKVVLKVEENEVCLTYENIGKARLST